MSEEGPRTVKVAVIGSGLAGLSAAYMLTKTTPSKDVRFQVHLFEKNTGLGMDAASISVGKDEQFRIDVPMRSFMSGYYSHLFRLYRHLEIDIKPARFSFGWYKIESPDPCQSKPTNRSYMTYTGSRTVGTLDLPKQSTENYWKQVFDLCWTGLIVGMSYAWLMILSLWYHYRGHLRNPRHPIAEQTLECWLNEHAIHPYFVHSVFVPLFAAVCTNSWRSMLDYPAADILEYMAMGLFQESYVVNSGVKQVVQRLSEPLENIHLNTHITHIRPGTVRRLALADNHGQVHEFDHVIFATQGNQALPILQEMRRHLFTEKSTADEYSEWKVQKDIQEDLESQIHMLEQFSYDTSIVINHTDTSLLPQYPADWKALNLATVDPSVPPSKSRYVIPFPHQTTMTTHILNMTHTAAATVESAETLYLQTTNPCIPPNESQILSCSWFERATVTIASKKAVQKYLFEPIKDDHNITRLGQSQGKNGFWFVGSYCWKGIPLLEGCVASADMVVREGIASMEGVSLEPVW
ncbi:hypothetical protein CLU79DRAFT_775987 [Phycomyces nitens]|nr:hypothetical protein CLU79DRAFT_775987 [Phycomyces nitens]